IPSGASGSAATPRRGSVARARRPRGASASASSSRRAGSTSSGGVVSAPARRRPAAEARNSGVASTAVNGSPAASPAATRWGPSSRADSPLLRRRRRISLSVLLWRLRIMLPDLKNFWQRLQSGVDVTVAAPSPDKLLGVRDGFLRFFHDGLDRAVPVAVVPQAVEEAPLGLPISDEEVLRLARQRVLALEQALGDSYHFY